MNSTETRLAECQRVIGYYFSNSRLLVTALTHSSLRAPDRECNERLEFLGDSILGLVITEELYHLLPDQSEGELTRIKSAVVSRSALLGASLRLGLPQYAEFARGVGKRDKLPASVVANLVEAVIGAIYLDAGYYPAREFVLRHLGTAIDDELHDRGAKNFKSLLQHEVQQSVGVTPTYRTLEAEGPDHAKEFVVAAIIRGQPWGRASGTTKKDAEQEAARKALEAWARRGRGRRRRRRRGGASPAGADAGPEAGGAEAGATPAAEADAASPSRKRRARRPVPAPDPVSESEPVTEAEPRRRTRRRARATPQDEAASDASPASATPARPARGRSRAGPPPEADDAPPPVPETPPRPARRRRASAAEDATAPARAAGDVPDAPPAEAPARAPRTRRRSAARPPAEAPTPRRPATDPGDRKAAPSAAVPRRAAAPKKAAVPKKAAAPKKVAPKKAAVPKKAAAPKKAAGAFAAGIETAPQEAESVAPPKPVKRKIKAPARREAPAAKRTRRKKGGFQDGLLED